MTGNEVADRHNARTRTRKLAPSCGAVRGTPGGPVTANPTCANLHYYKSCKDTFNLTISSTCIMAYAVTNFLELLEL